MAKKNHYEKKAEREDFLGSLTTELETKGDAKNSAIETGKDIVVGVIGGGVAGAIVGRASFLIGTAITGIGHYTKNKFASIFGMGMMASGGYQAMQGSVSGVEKEGLEGVKERLQNFKEDFKQRLFLDKILKSKKPNSETTNGMGEVKYFVYPNSDNSNEVDMSALEKIENQIRESGTNYAQQVSGTQDDVEEIDEKIY